MRLLLQPALADDAELRMDEIYEKLNPIKIKA